ncbi:MAG TPA: hypothetical protein VF184_01780, partial [Phycisphaeraceae bacterium]
IGIGSGTGLTWQLHARHGGSVNTMYADGHAAATKPEYFADLVNTQGEYSNGLPYYVWTAE